MGILLRQYRHLPRRKRKENIGIRSLFCSSLLQEKQTDLPFKKDSPVLYRFAMTAIKLPKAEAPEGFVPVLMLSSGQPVVVLDDDDGQRVRVGRPGGGGGNAGALRRRHGVGDGRPHHRDATNRRPRLGYVLPTEQRFLRPGMGVG